MAYIVKSGDSLSKIAQQNGLSLSQLLQLNPQYQANPNLIRPGESINLNASSQSTPSIAPPSPNRTIDLSTNSSAQNVFPAYEAPKVNVTSTISSLRSQIANGSISPQTALAQLNGEIQRQSTTARGSEISGAVMDAAKSQLFAPLTINANGKIGNLNSDGSISQKSVTVNQSTTSAGTGNTNSSTSYQTPTNYTVKSGDTLSKIASTNGMSLQQLLTFNPQYQANPNLINPGQSVKLNAVTTGATPTDQYAPGNTPPPPKLDSTNPFMTNLPASFNSWPEDAKYAYIQAANTADKALREGKIINPNVIEFTPEDIKKFSDQAHSELDPYYQQTLTAFKNDFDTFISRGIEDYNKSFREGGDLDPNKFKQTLSEQASKEAESGTIGSTGASERRRALIVSEQNVLDNALTKSTRDAQDQARIYEKGAGSLGARSLNIPGISTYTASKTGVTPTGTRSLYAPIGDINVGSEANKQKGLIDTRAAALDTERRRDLSLGSVL